MWVLAPNDELLKSRPFNLHAKAFELMISIEIRVSLWDTGAEG